VDNEAVENPVWPPRAVGTPTGVACARAIEQELGTNDKEHDVDEILIISPVLSNSLSFNFRLKLVALVKTIVVSYGANAETKEISINPPLPDEVRCSNIKRDPAG